MSTKNESLKTWVAEAAQLTKPDKIHWCDGSEQEKSSMIEQMLASGELIRLNEETNPGSYLHRSSPTDVARTEHLTFICTHREADAGPNNNWMAPADGHRLVDAIFDGWSPLRWCLFVEPVNVYRKTNVRLEAVLANEDVLRPGKYQVRLQVVGPGAERVFDRKLTVTIPKRTAAPQPPMAMKVFTADVAIDGPSGKYRFLATFERGAAAAGGDVEFYVADPAELPTVESEVVLWGEDVELAKWLADRGIRTRPYSPDGQTGREVILASRRPAEPGGAGAFAELARHIARGSMVVFLCPEVFAAGENRTAWVPLPNKGALANLPSWLYHKDEWAKKHPIFEGLPAGDLMDYTFYREIIPDAAWVGQDVPAEVVAGAINTSIDYSAGLFTSVHSLGAGRFVLNTLHIRENLGSHPAADRLLLNMLRHAARDAKKPPAELPGDFEARLKEIGYQ